MFVVRPATSFHSHQQPVWQQPTYEPFSAFLAPQPSRRQPSRADTRRSSYYPSQPAFYSPSAAAYNGVYGDACYDSDVELMHALGLSPQYGYHQRSSRGPSMDEVLMAQLLQEQRRQEAEEAERIYRARLLRERQRQQLEQQLLAERQRRVEWLRQQEQLRRQQLLRRAEEERQRREQEQADAFAVRLQEALQQLLGKQLLGQKEADEQYERPAAMLLMRQGEDRPKQAQAGAGARQLLSVPSPVASAARPASPTPTSKSSSPSSAHATSPVKPSTSAKQTPTSIPINTSSSIRPTIRIRATPITSSASAPSSPMPAPVASQQSANPTTDSSKRAAANPSITIPSPSAAASTSVTRRGSVEIEDVPSSPDRLKVDADEDVWAVEKRLYTPTPLITTTTTTTATPTATTTAA